jgi:hypothetical protein
MSYFELFSYGVSLIVCLHYIRATLKGRGAKGPREMQIYEYAKFLTFKKAKLVKYK